MGTPNGQIDRRGIIEIPLAELEQVFSGFGDIFEVVVNENLRRREKSDM